MIFQNRRGLTIGLNSTVFKDNPGIVAAFHKLLIVRNVVLGAPQGFLVLRISAYDTGQLNYWFYDGLEMELTLSDPLNNTVFTTKILVFGTPTVESTNPGLEEANEKTILKISFIFKSSYSFLLQLTKQNCYEGTLTSILNQFSTELGLSLSTNITDISQSLSWISYGRNYKNFLESILSYQRVDGDVLLYFLDMDGVLSVKQVGQTLLEIPKKVIKSCPIDLDESVEKSNEDSCNDNVYYTNKIRAKNYAGILNNIAGQNNIIKACSLVTDDYESNTVSILRSYNTVTEMNKNQVDTLVFYSPINTNEYDINNSIYYENLRKRCMFGNEVECTIGGTKASKVKILDEVSLEIDDKNKEMYSGRYIVASKTIEITLNGYSEKLGLLSYGKNYKKLANNL